jgi:hypothetical protein
MLRLTHALTAALIALVALAPVPVRSFAILDDLKAFYEFETNGNDSHSSSYHLTAENSPTHTTGKVGSAAAFSGAGFPSTPIYYRTSTADLQNGDIDWSYAGWLYITDAANTRYILSRWGETAATYRSFRLEFAQSFNLLRFVVGDGSTTNDVYSSTFGTVSADTWYYVAFGHRATANQIWISINAGTPDTASHTTGVIAGSGRLVFGALDTGDASLTDQGLPSRLDQWGYWKRDITSDVSALYNSGSGLSFAAMGGGSSAAPPRLLLLGAGGQ